MDAIPPRLRVATPGTLLALPQWPFRSLTTNTSCAPVFTPYDPPAAQLPGEAHDSALIEASEAPRAAKPRIAMARCQRPFRSLTTKALDVDVPAKSPPATQSLGDAQDTELTAACPDVFNVTMPGTRMASRQWPLCSLTTNADVRSDAGR